MDADKLTLLERYLDGTISDHEVTQLQQLLTESGEARATLRTLATIDVGLQDIAEGQLVPEQVIPRQVIGLDPAAASRTSANYFSRALLAAAALAIVALGTVIFLQRDAMPKVAAADRHIARITSLGGVVVWTGNGGNVTTNLKVGTPLTGGTIEGASPTSWVELEFDDGSTFTLSGDSQLTFSDLGQKILHLKEGKVASNVQPQPTDNPMLVYSRNARMEVLGTEFQVNSEIDSTSLAVTEGTVRFKRLSDGKSVNVPANQRVRAAGGIDLLPQPIPAVTSQWKSELDSPYNVFGKWMPKSKATPPRLKLVPYQHTTPDENDVMLQCGGVSVSNGDSKTVLLYRDSKIRVRGFARSSQRVVFGVSVRNLNNSFGGVYMAFDPSIVFWKRLSDFTKMQPSNAMEEFEVVVQASEFLLSPELEHSKQALKSSPNGCVVDSFFCISPIEETPMEITEIEIFRNDD